MKCMLGLNHYKFTTYLVVSGCVASLLLSSGTVSGCEIVQARTGRSAQTRPAQSDDDLKYWLENMLRNHRFRTEEALEVTGMDKDQLQSAIERLGVDLSPVEPYGDRLKLLPYPGGRHPRIGFLEGAIEPQRETKISVFTPWDASSYVVVDLPEAIFSNLGLTYLAHTHIPTIFDKAGMKLEAMEWKRDANGNLSLTRVLPNGISYTAKAVAAKDEIRMELSLKNGTGQKLTGLKVQQCAMLKGARGFDSQTNDNKEFKSPYAIVGNSDKTRWVIHAWSRPVRVWGNAPCPCLHSDPQFPDLEPGQEAKLVGRLWFYEGSDIEKFINEKKATGWDRE